MARVWLFIFLYGVTTIISFFLTVFWTRLAIVRAREINHSIFKDKAFVLAAAIATVAGGTMLMHGARVVGNLDYGLSLILRNGDAYAVAIGLVLCIIGFLKMTWLADLEKHPPKWTWLRAMLGATVLWGITSALLAPGVPFIQ